MPFRRDPERDERDLTARRHRQGIHYEREPIYAASGFTKKSFNFNNLTESSQFGMDARPNPVLPPFRLRRRPGSHSFCVWAWGFLPLACVQSHRK
jgi:hypothetical protein